MGFKRAVFKNSKGAGRVITEVHILYCTRMYAHAWFFESEQEARACLLIEYPGTQEARLETRRRREARSETEGEGERYMWCASRARRVCARRARECACGWTLDFFFFLFFCPPYLGEEEHAVALLTLAHGHAWAVPETALDLHPRVRRFNFHPSMHHHHHHHHHSLVFVFNFALSPRGSTEVGEILDSRGVVIFHTPDGGVVREA